MRVGGTICHTCFRVTGIIVLLIITVILLTIMLVFTVVQATVWLSSSSLRCGLDQSPRHGKGDERKQPTSVA